MSFSWHIPLPNSSQWWHPSGVSSDKGFRWDLYLVLDQEKQTCRYSPLKEALVTCPIGWVFWPLHRFSLVLHNPVGPKMTEKQASVFRKASWHKRKTNQGSNTPSANEKFATLTVIRQNYVEIQSQSALEQPESLQSIKNHWIWESSNLTIVIIMWEADKIADF